MGQASCLSLNDRQDACPTNLGQDKALLIPFLTIVQSSFLISPFIILISLVTGISLGQTRVHS